MYMTGQTKLHLLLDRKLAVPTAVFNQIEREDGPKAARAAIDWVLRGVLKNL
jgi:hypothetical protein